MKSLAFSIVILIVVIFAAVILILDICVERYKEWRDRRDRRVRNHAVGAFSGVQTQQKRWQSE